MSTKNVSDSNPGYDYVADVFSSMAKGPSAPEKVTGIALSRLTTQKDILGLGEEYSIPTRFPTLQLGSTAKAPSASSFSTLEEDPGFDFVDGDISLPPSQAPKPKEDFLLPLRASSSAKLKRCTTNSKISPSAEGHEFDYVPKEVVPRPMKRSPAFDSHASLRALAAAEKPSRTATLASPKPVKSRSSKRSTKHRSLAPLPVGPTDPARANVEKILKKKILWHTLREFMQKPTEREAAKGKTTLSEYPRTKRISERNVSPLMLEHHADPSNLDPVMPLGLFLKAARDLGISAEHPRILFIKLSSNRKAE